MLSRLRLSIARIIAPAAAPDDATREEHGPITMRRWEAADTDRLNAAQWRGATGAPINADLLSDLETLRTRVLYERQQNAFLDGVINTHKTDVIGATGPTLQVLTEDDEWRKTVERHIEALFEVISYDGTMSMCDVLQLAVDQLWTTGDILTQIKNVGRDEENSLRRSGQMPETPISLRLHPLAPQRMNTPNDRLGERHILLGVERTHEGRPLGYWIQNERVGEPHVYTYPSWDFFDRRSIIHEFRPIEPGQVRGFPWAAPCLKTLNDLREYDGEVMEAARAAAFHAIVMFTKDPDLERPRAPVKGTAKVEKGAYNFAPPGYEPAQIKPEHPSLQYTEFRSERLRELGRPVGMPLMMVKIDSSGHNYSSARFDGQIYLRQLRMIQRWLERRVLMRVLRLAILELQRLNVLQQTPDDVEYHWTWPEPPHVDPAKEGIGIQLQLDSGTIDEYTAAAHYGRDYDDVLRNRKRAQKARMREGLPEPNAGDSSGVTGTGPSNPTPQTPGGDQSGTGTAAGTGERRTIGASLINRMKDTEFASVVIDDEPALKNTNGVHRS